MLVFNVVTFEGDRIQIPVDLVWEVYRSDDGTEKGMFLGSFDDKDCVDFKLIYPDKESKKSGLHPSISESIEDVNYPDGFYAYYIKSRMWNTKRTERLRIDDFRCVSCRTEKNLQVHHINYENLGHEDVVNDLITLCRKCHAKLHGKDAGEGDS